MHEAMDAMITEFAPDRLPDHGEPWSRVHHRRLHDLAVDLAHGVEERGLTGHPRLWQAERARILRDLDRMLRDDDQWRAKLDAKVLASELTFGLGESEPVRLELGDGRGTVLMKGKADKVDVTRHGVLLVTDIKTGSSTSYKKIKKDPVVDGTKLQLPAYAYAARNAFGDNDASRPVLVRAQSHRTDPGQHGRDHRTALPRRRGDLGQRHLRGSVPGQAAGDRLRLRLPLLQSRRGGS